ncbi:SGNH/GDSL hydrolase family protein [Mycoplasmoides fastidiosum]|uniref:SGNH/GDSL hydrolase family protein n=1 Tax=Mycoplasmoides fastidiosum TaxID=92758 RepID=UPI002114FFD2|nr:SGNH/GDSL hydrolase family protein [Mycoplasmoides fastidiosum]UUD38148.1 SGNH/GDSL hydrolase family protein [Mycoplasmoides fastidiosum]
MDTSGQFNSDTKQITGWSYPSYFANYIQQTQPDLIDSYHNLGLSGSTIDDWLYLLGENDSSYHPDNRFNLFDSLKKDNQKNQNPYLSRFDEYFGQGADAFKQSGFTKSLEKIKAANLITISLSANDFFNKFNFAELFTKTDYQTLSQKIRSVVQTITASYVKLINKLKTINSQATIILVNYPQPLLRLTSLINGELTKLLQTKDVEVTDLLGSLFDIVNRIPHNTYENLTNKDKVNFISVFNSTFWNKYKKELAHNLFDIHPTKYGQKQIGLELFLKLSLDQSKTESKDPENSTSELQKLNPFWAMNEQYLTQDLGTFRQFLKFGPENTFTKLVEKYVGTNDKPLVLEDNLPNDTNASLEKIAKLESWSYPLRFFLNNLASSNGNGNLYSVLRSLVFTTVAATPELDRFMITAYENKSNFVHLLNYLLEDRSFLNTFLNNLVKKLDTLTNQDFTQTVLETTLQAVFAAVNPISYLSILTQLLNLAKQDFIKDQVEIIKPLIEPNGDLNIIVVNLIKQFLPKLETLGDIVKSLLHIDHKNLDGLLSKSNFEVATQNFAKELLTLFLVTSGNALVDIPNKLSHYIDELNKPAQTSTK